MYKIFGATMASSYVYKTQVPLAAEDRSYKYDLGSNLIVGRTAVGTQKFQTT
jgi:hypothetical protein